MIARTHPADDEGDVPAAGWQRTVAIACVLGATVLVVLDAAVTNVALPDIARSLRVSPAASLGVVTAYQLALVIGLLPFAALGESRGLRQVYAVGVALFVVASIVCAHASSLSTLVVARFVQGLGGAAILALGTALLRLVVPSRQIGAAIGWYAMAVALASAAGPPIGALLVAAAGWSSIFAINLPIGVLVGLATRALPRTTGHARAIDRISVALHGAVFAALVGGAEQFAQRPVVALALLVAGTLAAVALVRREMPRRAPMIPFDLLREVPFRLAVLASIGCFVGQSAAMVALPFHLQHGLGLGTLQAGLAITPWPLTVAIVAPIAGRLSDRFSSAILCAAGGALLSLGLAGAALAPAAAGPLALVPFVMLAGAGFGLFQVPNNRTLLLSAPRARSGAAGGMQGTARLTGQTIGALVVTWLFTATPNDAAPRVGLAIASVLAALAGGVSLLRVWSAPNPEPVILSLARRPPAPAESPPP